MFSGLQPAQIKGALEAMLFLSDEPVSALVLSEMIECAPTEVQAALQELSEEFEAQNRGIQLREIAGGWRLFTHPVYHELLERYVLSWDTRKLSQAAIETLAIVAYSQPVTRSLVSAIRGVSSDSSINSLIDKGLVREVGVDSEQGNATLYATTKEFLERFGLKSTKDLPPLEEYAPDEETRAFIRERLSATQGNADNMIVDPGAEEEEWELELDPESKTISTSEGKEFPQSLAQTMLAEAMSAHMGAVEKVDLDALELSLDDE